MTKPLSLLAVSVLSFSLASCGERKVRGGGSDGTETRALSAFSAVDIGGSEAVEFLPAAAARVEITGYKNLLPHYKTGVEDGVLYLGFEGEEDIRISNSNLRVRVYGPGFERLALAGSGKAVVQLGATTLLREVSLAGSGAVTVRQADAQALELAVSGSGDIHAREARASRVEAKISGSGKIETSPVASLSASIAGSGNVHYWGAPQVEQNVSGSGDVVRH